MREIIFWGLAFVILVIAEIFTVQFVSIWLAIAALVSMILSIFNFEFWQQSLVFVIVSAILLLATRPVAKKFNSTRKVGTNSELNIGKTAIVIEEIDAVQTKGRVKLDGVDWIARASDDSYIPEGTAVKVEKIDGAKLIVHV